jgi:enamine deaminase RidA (YjgF/YER057c/UK114 family)
MNPIEQALSANGITLPVANAAAGQYVPAARGGSLLYVSGQTPKVDGSLVYTGRIDSDRDIGTAREAAALCAINVLAQVKMACDGDLSRVLRCIRVGGYVQSGPDFFKQSYVIDAASDVFCEAFGPAGRHARTSIGVISLPGNAMVEVDAIFEVAG